MREEVMPLRLEPSGHRAITASRISSPTTIVRKIRRETCRSGAADAVLKGRISRRLIPVRFWCTDVPAGCTALLARRCEAEGGVYRCD